MDSADSASAIQQCKERLKVGKGDRSFPKTQTIIGLLSKARNKEISIGDVLQRDAQHLLPHADALESIGEAYRGCSTTTACCSSLRICLKAIPRRGAKGLPSGSGNATATSWWTSIRTPTAFRPGWCGSSPGKRATSWPWATTPSPSTPSGARTSATSSTSPSCSPERGSSGLRRTTAPHSPCSTSPTRCWPRPPRVSAKTCSRPRKTRPKRPACASSAP